MPKRVTLGPRKWWTMEMTKVCLTKGVIHFKIHGPAWLRRAGRCEGPRTPIGKSESTVPASLVCHQNLQIGDKGAGEYGKLRIIPTVQVNALHAEVVYICDAV